MRFRIFKNKSLMALMLLFSVFSTSIQAQTATYNHQTGLAPVGVVLPVAVPLITETWGPGCASLIFRLAMLLGNAWFDATAPYTATTVGVHSDLGRRPPIEAEDFETRNIAAIYASYQLLMNQFPMHEDVWREMMVNVDLDPDASERNMETPIGIGNMAGDAVIAWAVQDGMNQYGTDGGCKYNCVPFSDTTNYSPVNDPWPAEPVDASQWAPWITSPLQNGVFTAQQFVTPQYATAKAYSFDDPSVFAAPEPRASNPENMAAYKSQVDQVLARSAALAESDFLKLRAELFDNKFRGYAGAIFQSAQSHSLTYNQWIQWYFTANLAAYDAGIAAWHEKTRFNAVRPYTAIPYVYGDTEVTAWGGVGKGLVTDLPASQWRQYLNVADHPEYPSGSGIFCSAIAQAGRNFFGDDVLGFRDTWFRGTSLIEPGITPASRLTISYDDWTTWENSCFQARVDGGVHFPASVRAAPAIGEPIADLVHEFVQNYVNGNVE